MGANLSVFSIPRYQALGNTSAQITDAAGKNSCDPEIPVARRRGIAAAIILRMGFAIAGSNENVAGQSFFLKTD